MDDGLHTPQHDGRRHFCGPTAIAAITGATFPEIYKKIRRVRSGQLKAMYGYAVKDAGRDTAGRKTPIKGMRNDELLIVMQRMGFKMKQGFQAKRMTLGQLLEDRGHLGPMIVNVTHHYIAVSRGTICDTITRVPVPISAYPKLKYRVECFWQF